MTSNVFISYQCKQRLLNGTIVVTNDSRSWPLVGDLTMAVIESKLASIKKQTLSYEVNLIHAHELESDGTPTPPLQKPLIVDGVVVSPSSSKDEIPPRMIRITGEYVYYRPSSVYFGIVRKEVKEFVREFTTNEVFTNQLLNAATKLLRQDFNDKYAGRGYKDLRVVILEFS